MLLSKTVLNSSAVDTDSFTKFEFQKSDIWNIIETKLGPKFHFLKNTMEKLPKNTPVNIRKIQTLLNERVLTVSDFIRKVRYNVPTSVGLSFAIALVGGLLIITWKFLKKRKPKTHVLLPTVDDNNLVKAENNIYPSIKEF